MLLWAMTAHQDAAQWSFPAFHCCFHFPLLSTHCHHVYVKSLQEVPLSFKQLSLSLSFSSPPSFLPHCLSLPLSISLFFFPFLFSSPYFFPPYIPSSPFPSLFLFYIFQLYNSNLEWSEKIFSYFGQQWDSIYES